LTKGGFLYHEKNWEIIIDISGFSGSA
jgi:hypothetical protein